jgi:hypothetical protein
VLSKAHQRKAPNRYAQITMTRQAVIILSILYLLSVAFKQPTNTKTVKEITFFINKLYDIKTGVTIDSLLDFSKIKSDTLLGLYDNPYGLVNYAKADIKRYYRYISFEFFVFKDKGKALRQFSELIRLSQTKSSFDTPDGKKYLNLFSKAGCTYILYDNMIIQHTRRCNYNENVEKPRETKLLNYLFNDKLPTDKYFIRILCGWSEPEIK